MKKKLIILGIASIALLTGCGQQNENKYTTGVENTEPTEKQMVCTRTTNMNGVEMDLRYEVYYEGENVNRVQTTEKVKSDSQEVLNQFKDQVETLYSNFDDIENYNYNVTIEGNLLTSTTDINYTKINMDELLAVDSSIEQLLNDNDKIDLDTIIQVYEAAGATCEEE